MDIEDKTRLQERRLNGRLKKFGINWDQYKQILKDQDYSCAICNSKEVYKNSSKHYLLNVDHDHNTGQVRGLLCMHCNTGLSHFKDNIQVLTNAISYLERDYKVPLVERTQINFAKDEVRRKRYIIHTPKGTFSSSLMAAKNYNVHETTILCWCGILKHNPKQGFTYEKVCMSLKEAREKYKTND